MDKVSFLNQFRHMNGLIQQAILGKDFVKVAAIEDAKQNLLHTFTSRYELDNDPKFFEAIEACAEDHANALLQVTNDLQAMKRSSTKALKLLSRYKN